MRVITIPITSQPKVAPIDLIGSRGIGTPATTVTPTGATVTTSNDALVIKINSRRFSLQSNGGIPLELTDNQLIDSNAA